MTQPTLFDSLRFNGPDYVPARDNIRLGKQITKIFEVMKDGNWRTLQQIHSATGEPPASISAQLRHLKKERFGGHTLNKKYLGNGLFEYQIIINATKLF